MKRIRDILAEQATLFAEYPELRRDPRRPGTPTNGTSVEPVAAVLIQPAPDSRLTGPLKKYVVF